MLLIILIVLIANAILSHVIAKQGEDRKIGYTNSFLVSFVFSPLIGLLLVIASKELTNEEKKNVSYSGGKRPLYVDWVKDNPGKTILDYLNKYK